MAIARALVNNPAMILAETALSFLGLGLRPPTTSWGVLLQEARQSAGREQQEALFDRDAHADKERLVGASSSFEHTLLAGESWLGAKQYDKALPHFEEIPLRELSAEAGLDAHFIPEISISLVTSSWRSHPSNLEYAAVEYLGKLPVINAWGPYNWYVFGRGPYDYVRGLHLSCHVTAREVLGFTAAQPARPHTSRSTPKKARLPLYLRLSRPDVFMLHLLLLAHGVDIFAVENDGDIAVEIGAGLVDKAADGKIATAVAEKGVAAPGRRCPGRGDCRPRHIAAAPRAQPPTTAAEPGNGRGRGHK